MGENARATMMYEGSNVTATSSSGAELRGTKIAIVGVGKIALDQHIPAIAGLEAFELAATASRAGSVEGIENYSDIAGLLAAHPDIPALSLCIPPVPRYDIAVKSLMAGKHTMLEKPPGATVSEVRKLEKLAQAKGVTLFATWHSRYADGVAAARAWLSDRKITSVQIDWKEDVRRWHPGQEWIWQPGGLGVFDPGINALSIMTEILPNPVHLNSAELFFPKNRATPIAANLNFSGPAGMAVNADFDWRQEGPQSWNITVKTTEGLLQLTQGGAKLTINGVDQTLPDVGEYPGLYHRFAELIETGKSDVDISPLLHVADAFMLGERKTVDAFHD